MQENQVAHLVELSEIHGESGSSTVISDPLQVIRGIKVAVEAVVGHGELEVRALEKLTDGSVIKLNRLANDPIDIVVEGKVVARGVLVAVDDYFGVRVIEVAPSPK